MSSQRVTPECVLAALERSNLTPRRDVFKRQDQVCGIGAVVVDALRHLDRPHPDVRSAEVLEIAESYYGRDYTWGFIDGFEGTNKDYHDRHKDNGSRRSQGYLDGLASAAAVFGRGEQ